MMCSRRSQSLNKEDRGVGLGNSPFVRLMFKVVRSHSLHIRGILEISPT